MALGSGSKMILASGAGEPQTAGESSGALSDGQLTAEREQLEASYQQLDQQRERVHAALDAAASASAAAMSAAGRVQAYEASQLEKKMAAIEAKRQAKLQELAHQQERRKIERERAREWQLQEQRRLAEEQVRQTQEQVLDLQRMAAQQLERLSDLLIDGGSDHCKEILEEEFGMDEPLSPIRPLESVVLTDSDINTLSNLIMEDDYDELSSDSKPPFTREQLEQEEQMREYQKQLKESINNITSTFDANLEDNASSSDSDDTLSDSDHGWASSSSSEDTISSSDGEDDEDMIGPMQLEEEKKDDHAVITAASATSSGPLHGTRAQQRQTPVATSSQKANAQPPRRRSTLELDGGSDPSNAMELWQTGKAHWTSTAESSIPEHPGQQRRRRRSSTLQNKKTTRGIDEPLSPPPHPPPHVRGRLPREQPDPRSLSPPRNVRRRRSSSLTDMDRARKAATASTSGDSHGASDAPPFDWSTYQKRKPSSQFSDSAGKDVNHQRNIVDHMSKSMSALTAPPTTSQAAAKKKPARLSDFLQASRSSLPQLPSSIGDSDAAANGPDSPRRNKLKLLHQQISEQDVLFQETLEMISLEASSLEEEDEASRHRRLQKEQPSPLEASLSQQQQRQQKEAKLHHQPKTKPPTLRQPQLPPSQPPQQQRPKPSPPPSTLDLVSKPSDEDLNHPQSLLENSLTDVFFEDGSDTKGSKTREEGDELIYAQDEDDNDDEDMPRHQQHILQMSSSWNDLFSSSQSSLTQQLNLPRRRGSLGGGSSSNNSSDTAMQLDSSDGGSSSGGGGDVNNNFGESINELEHEARPPVAMTTVNPPPEELLHLSGSLTDFFVHDEDDEDVELTFEETIALRKELGLPIHVNIKNNSNTLSGGKNNNNVDDGPEVALHKFNDSGSVASDVWSFSHSSDDPSKLLSKFQMQAGDDFSQFTEVSGGNNATALLKHLQATKKEGAPAFRWDMRNNKNNAELGPSSHHATNTTISSLSSSQNRSSTSTHKSRKHIKNPMKEMRAKRREHKKMKKGSSHKSSPGEEPQRGTENENPHHKLHHLNRRGSLGEHLHHSTSPPETSKGPVSMKSSETSSKVEEKKTKKLERTRRPPARERRNASRRTRSRSLTDLGRMKANRQQKQHHHHHHHAHKHGQGRRDTTEKEKTTLASTSAEDAKITKYKHLVGDLVQQDEHVSSAMNRNSTSSDREGSDHSGQSQPGYNWAQSRSGQEGTKSSTDRLLAIGGNGDEDDDDDDDNSGKLRYGGMERRRSSSLTDLVIVVHNSDSEKAPDYDWASYASPDPIVTTPSVMHFTSSTHDGGKGSLTEHLERDRHVKSLFDEGDQSVKSMDFAPKKAVRRCTAAPLAGNNVMDGGDSTSDSEMHDSYDWNHHSQSRIGGSISGEDSKQNNKISNTKPRTSILEADYDSDRLDDSASDDDIAVLRSTKPCGSSNKKRLSDFLNASKDNQSEEAINKIFDWTTSLKDGALDASTRPGADGSVISSDASNSIFLPPVGGTDESVARSFDAPAKKPLCPQPSFRGQPPNEADKEPAYNWASHKQNDQVGGNENASHETESGPENDEDSDAYSDQEKRPSLQEFLDVNKVPIETGNSDHGVNITVDSSAGTIAASSAEETFATCTDTEAADARIQAPELVSSDIRTALSALTTNIINVEEEKGSIEEETKADALEDIEYKEAPRDSATDAGKPSSIEIGTEQEEAEEVAPEKCLSPAGNAFKLAPLDSVTDAERSPPMEKSTKQEEGEEVASEKDPSFEGFTGLNTTLPQPERSDSVGNEIAGSSINTCISKASCEIACRISDTETIDMPVKKPQRVFNEDSVRTSSTALAAPSAIGVVAEGTIAEEALLAEEALSEQSTSLPNGNAAKRIERMFNEGAGLTSSSEGTKKKPETMTEENEPEPQNATEVSDRTMKKPVRVFNEDSIRTSSTALTNAILSTSGYATAAKGEEEAPAIKQVTEINGDKPSSKPERVFNENSVRVTSTALAAAHTYVSSGQNVPETIAEGSEVGLFIAASEEDPMLNPVTASSDNCPRGAADSFGPVAEEKVQEAGETSADKVVHLVNLNAFDGQQRGRDHDRRGGVVKTRSMSDFRQFVDNDATKEKESATKGMKRESTRSSTRKEGEKRKSRSKSWSDARKSRDRGDLVTDKASHHVSKRLSSREPTESKDSKRGVHRTRSRSLTDLRRGSGEHNAKGHKRRSSSRGGSNNERRRSVQERGKGPPRTDIGGFLQKQKNIAEEEAVRHWGHESKSRSTGSDDSMTRSPESAGSVESNPGHDRKARRQRRTSNRSHESMKKSGDGRNQDKSSRRRRSRSRSLSDVDRFKQLSKSTSAIASKTSHESTARRNSKSAITSKTSHESTARRNSRRGMDSSRRGMDSSRRGMGSSRCGMGSSRRGMDSSHRGMDSSHRTMGRSSRRGIDSSRRGIDSSDRAMERSSRRGMDSSRRGMDSSHCRRRMDSSDRQMDSSHRHGSKHNRLKKDIKGRKHEKSKNTTRGRDPEHPKLRRHRSRSLTDMDATRKEHHRRKSSSSNQMSDSDKGATNVRDPAERGRGPERKRPERQRSRSLTDMGRDRKGSKKPEKPQGPSSEHGTGRPSFSSYDWQQHSQSTRSMILNSPKPRRASSPDRDNVDQNTRGRAQERKRPERQRSSSLSEMDRAKRGSKRPSTTAELDSKSEHASSSSSRPSLVTYDWRQHSESTRSMISNSAKPQRASSPERERSGRTGKRPQRQGSKSLTESDRATKKGSKRPGQQQQDEETKNQSSSLEQEQSRPGMLSYDWRRHSESTKSMVLNSPKPKRAASPQTHDRRASLQRTRSLSLSNLFGDKTRAHTPSNNHMSPSRNKTGTVAAYNWNQHLSPKGTGRSSQRNLVAE
jgi:hypothetical protein